MHQDDGKGTALTVTDLRLVQAQMNGQRMGTGEVEIAPRMAAKIVRDAHQGPRSPATGYHDARNSVREAAVRGQGTRTDRAYRRGLRGRGMR